jgi:hypothetical protein
MGGTEWAQINSIGSGSGSGVAGAGVAGAGVAGAGVAGAGVAGAGVAGAGVAGAGVAGVSWVQAPARPATRISVIKHIPKRIPNFLIFNCSLLILRSILLL